MRKSWMPTMHAVRARHLHFALALAVAGAVLSGCGSNTFLQKIIGEEPKPEELPTLGDRFNQLFGRPKAAPAEEDAGANCPPVNIRPGAATYAVAAPGKQAVGSDVRYQVIITRTARDCRQNGDQITARIGIQGRVIAGPAGNPPTVEIPVRIAVVQGGVREKPIATKAYRTTVSFAEGGSVPFSLVAEDLEYPVPPGEIGDSYIFYIGFDPEALTPEPAAKPARKKKQG